MEDEQEARQIRRMQEEEQMKEFNCKICMESYEMDDENDDQEEPFCLQQCENVFHAECLVTYLETQIKDSKLPLVCPDAGCREEIADTDLKELLSRELYVKYSHFALSQAVDQQNDISWCPTADCKFAFVYEDDGNGQQSAELHCPLCKTHYCLNCRVAYHEGMSCKEY